MKFKDVALKIWSYLFDTV